MSASFIRTPLCFLAGLASATLITASASAVGPITYDINPNLSQLNLTAAGSVLGGALVVTEQHANSPTRYDGTVEVSFPNGPWSNSASISFPGGSSMEAQNLRGGFFNSQLNVTPGVGGSGSGAPANYGLNLTAPLDIALPDLPLNGVNISLGTLSGVQLSLALRDVVWDVQTNTPGGSPIGINDQFDASGGAGVQLSLAGGFADLAGSLVLRQSNAFAAAALQLALGALVSQAPQLGLTVSRPNLFSPDVLVGIGTRVDLSTLGGNLALPNGTTTPGTLTWNELTGASTLTLPIDISLGDFGLPADIIDIDLGFNGKIVATGVVVIPEPASGTFLAFAAIGLVGTQVRRRRSA
jgi:hypothetical protein